MAAAAAFSAYGRRLLSTAAGAAAFELPVPIAQIRSLARAGRVDDIDAILAPLAPRNPAAALSAFSSVGLPERGSALLDTIPSPTAAHLNALLGPLLRRQRFARLIPSLLDAHPTVPRDAVTDSILAKSLCLTSGADSALQLLEEGRATPSLQFFTSIVDSYYKQKQPHRAEELWRAMVDDHGIVPDVAAHNVRITYKSMNGTVEEVNELIRAMREDAGLTPDVVSYNAQMRVLARHGRVKEMLDVYRSLQEEEKEEEEGEKGEGDDKVKAAAVAEEQEEEDGKSDAAPFKSAPQCATYTCVVGALCKAGLWSEAEDVFYEGVKRRKVADLGTVRMLVRGLKTAGKGRAARRVVVGLRKKFPDRFDGPWKDLEEVAGISAGKDDNDEGQDDEQPAAAATAA